MTDRSLVSFMISISLTTIIAAVGIATLQDHTALAGTFPGPNGKIAFESTRDGNDEIYVMNADGTGQTRLTNNAAHDFRPSWSPNGSKIAFVSDRDGNFEIYVMNADGTGQTNLSNSFPQDSEPDWGTLQGIICPGPGPATVGAEILPVDSTALLIAGASANAYWMLPTSVAVIGAIVGVFLIRRVDVSR